MKQKFTLVLIVAAFCSLKFNTAKAQVNVQDSLALVDLYNSTNGPGWYNHTNWLTSAPVSTWFEVYVIGNRISELDLIYNNLAGTLPTSIGNLTGITSLQLWGNNLNGSIPNSIGNLLNLTSLNLSTNHLSGSIPSTIGNLTNLWELSLWENNLSGNIPSSIGKLTNLNICALEINQLSGNIPSSFDKLINLISIELGSNQLTGSIQSIFNKLTKMVFLDIGGNQFTGNLSFLNTMQSLDYADLHFNQFSGKIPVLNNIDSIGYLDLSHNQLSGSITKFHKSRVIEFLNLSYNLLSGNINQKFDSLSTVENLDIFLNNNQLSGNVPLQNLAHLTSIDLSNNKLNGIILPVNDTIYYNNLEYLNLSHNQLTSKIPASINKLYFLHSVDVSSNHLSGKVPSLNKINLPYLSNLQLDSNEFTFAGMENIADAFPFAVYSPQANVHVSRKGYKLSVSAGGTLSNNTYTWYKNGSLFKKIVGDSVIILHGKGTYNVIITNAVATALTLYSDTINYTAGNNVIASKMNNNSSISLYPNPAKTNATLSFNADGKYAITVTDVSGKILQTKTGVAIKGENIIQLDVSQYASGIYLITIADEKNKKQTLKLNKE